MNNSKRRMLLPSGNFRLKEKKSSTKSSRDTGRNVNGCNGNSQGTPPKETERFFG
jgi:hypothetical protein